MRADLLVIGTLLFGLTACSNQSAQRDAIRLTGGDPAKGAAVIARYGCGSCHTISPLQSARGLVGPALDGLRNRMYVAGMLHNNADNLANWVQNPKAVNPKTAMPALGVSKDEARDVAAYLYSIE
ncbi:MAG TPA: c-type cytochrome [Bryobacteraceae bacterium]|jgi:cytochrome c2|nr:c-type cytochrome [Bryobacteraceae bacterium]